MVEYCTGEQSLLGQATSSSRGCKIVRITEKINARSSEGHALALREATRKSLSSPPVLLWASLPCTGGSPWFNINVRKPGGWKRLKDHRALFKKLWAKFVIVCEECLASGGDTCIEWPTGCAYWKFKFVQDFLSKHSFFITKIHGLSLIHI